MNKKKLSERDICTKIITPALEKAGWTQKQIREEVTLTRGRIMVRGNMATRITNPKTKGGPKRADYVLYAKPNLPIAIIEAKKNKFPIGHGMQQGLLYAEMMDVPFVFSSNGDGFLMHDRTGLMEAVEQELTLDQFPHLDSLWTLFEQWKGIESKPNKELVAQSYYSDGNISPYYYQQVAINRTIEAVIKEQKRILLVMATGTGKTYTAFQIIWRLWKAKQKKRILFLADRNILVDQTMQQDFVPFGGVMHKITNRTAKKNFEIYLSLYQAVTGNEEEKQIFKEFPKDFFDLVVIDECHRGSAREDSAWRAILDHFSEATHLGMTATPKETKEVSNINYFGDPIYTYSLKQGIEDGFLAPYKVIRIVSDVDAAGYLPEKGKRDKYGYEVEQRHYNTKDFDRKMVLRERTKLVARKVWEYLKETDPKAKTIVFCDDQPHAERMRQELVNLIPEAASNRKYVVRITGDDKEGKAQLTYFIDNDEEFPVIATTSKLLSTGVDAKTCKVIVLDQNINSMAEFKQIIGRGTRLREDYQKLFFTIIDFKGATRLFADPDFDGEPTLIYEPTEDDPIVPPDEEEEIEEPITDEEETDDDGIDDGEQDDDLTDDDDDLDEDEEEDEDEIPERPAKYHIDDVAVQTAVERSQYLDADGKLITEDYRTFLMEDIKKTVTEQYQTMADFLKRWNESERKKAVVKELESFGISVKMLRAAVPDGETIDIFDLVLHIVFDQKPLTRKERADNVKKRDYFGKYQDQAREVLESLLEKYAHNGIVEIENPKVLELPPFDAIGSKRQIRREIFGGLDQYSKAVTELEQALYENDETISA